MQRIILLVSLIALTSAGINKVTQQNVDLFKYSPNDIYTLPEDVDDDKPPVIFSGPEMNARTELLENVNYGKQFKLHLKTQNGIDVQQVGKLKDSKTFVISGQYSFTGADGKRYKTRYTADEFGYHPMTELDLDIPDPVPAAPVKQNTFKFLNQNLDSQDFFDRIAANRAAQNSPASHPQLNTRLGAVQETVHVLQAQTGGHIGTPAGIGALDANRQVPYTRVDVGISGGHNNPLENRFGGNNYPSGNGYGNNDNLPGNGFGPLRGSGQSGDDYSYGPQDLSDHSLSGYNYNPPQIQNLPRTFQ